MSSRIYVPCRICHELRETSRADCPTCTRRAAAIRVTTRYELETTEAPPPLRSPTTWPIRIALAVALLTSLILIYAHFLQAAPLMTFGR